VWRLQHFDRDAFLAEYWQKKPLLIRGAFADFDPLITPEELAGLAMEPGVHSRLVIEKDAETPWQLSYGPFDEERFTALPRSHYSLLVSECEKWLPELRQLIDEFSFIPRWRIDDVMISYAPDGGSVGPHIDDYDVFLIQASGRREWMIEQQARQRPKIIEGLDLAILRDFHPDQQWVLEPGDLLYLPPRIPHHGVARGEGCMTWSVGFRAPAVSDLMDSLLLEADSAGLASERYADGDLRVPRDPAELLDEDLDGFRRLARELLERIERNGLWPRIVGRLVTDTTLAEDIQGIRIDTPAQAADLRWQPHPDSRFCFHRQGDALDLFCNGRHYRLAASAVPLNGLSRLCNAAHMNWDELQVEHSEAWRDCLLELINEAALIPLEDDDD